MRYLIGAVLVLLVSALQGKASDQVLGLASLIHEFALKDQSDTEWKDFVSGARESRKQWEAKRNVSGAQNSFLDERLKEYARAALTDIVKMKILVRWLALYNEFNEPLPEYIQQSASDMWSQVEMLRRQGVTWESLMPLTQHTALPAQREPVPEQIYAQQVPVAVVERVH